MDEPEKEVITLEPLPGMQREVLSSPAYELLMGGQAGPGKTWSLLFEDIPDLLNPVLKRLRVFYFRRKYIDLGDLIDKAADMWIPLGAKYTAADSGFGKKTTFTWPSGAKCVLSHMANENDKFSWQGFECQRLRFDELTHFTEGQYLYLFSRVRFPKGTAFPPGFQCNIRSSCNPQGDGKLWVKRRFIDKLQPGEMRWFIRDMVGRDIEVPHGTHQALSRTWIPGDRAENTYLGDEYEATLRAMPREDYLALSLGIWDEDDTPNQMIETKWWNQAVQGGDPEAQRLSISPVSSQRYAIGADYAHEGQDFSTMCWGKGSKILGFEEKSRTRTEVFAHWVSEKYYELGDRKTEVGSDGNGPGVGACDVLERGAKFLVNGEEIVVRKVARLNRMTHKDPTYMLKFKDAPKFDNLRSQMWWRFREDMERGLIDLSWLASEECDYNGVEELQAEILAHTYETVNGTLRIVSKRVLRKSGVLGRSPDRADALVIWNWVRRRDAVLGAGDYHDEILIRGIQQRRKLLRDLGDGSGWV